MKLYLVGLLGSGKSVLGKKIAEEAYLPFIDLDDVIEKEEGAKIQELFSSKGENYFRQVEAKHLREQSQAREFVMATGGGTPCFHDNMGFMNDHGTSIFLNTPIKEIVKRMDLHQKNARPLLSSVPDDLLEQKLKEMLQNRLPYYRQAHVTVGSFVTASEILQSISKK